MAKAGLWAVTDAEERKRGERTGLDTLVVHAVNGGCWMWGPFQDGIGDSLFEKIKMYIKV